MGVPDIRALGKNTQGVTRYKLLPLPVFIISVDGMRKFVLLAVLLIAAFTVDVTLRANVSKIAALFAPTYYPINDEEAYELGKNDRYAGLRAPWYNRIEAGRTKHLREFQRNRITPIEDNIKQAINIAMPITYTIIGVIAALLLLRWLTHRVNLLFERVQLPRVRLKLTSLRNYLYSYLIIRKEKEFSSLKTLFDNGMLSPEEYERRRTLIRIKLHGYASKLEV